MIPRLCAITSLELRILMRNRWFAIAALLMLAFSLLIAFAGSAPVGTIAADRLTVTAASLATLMVYLVPLIALLISYDSIAGEAARGTLALLLSYPASRMELLLGKSIAQLVVIAIAILAGIGSATLLVYFTDTPDEEALAHILRLGWSACVLGAAFLAIGNFISAATSEPRTAAALAIAIWVIAVVMVDVALLAALVGDDGGVFTRKIFPWLLLASPTDAFRLFNLSQIDARAITGGIASASGTTSIPAALALISLFAWPVLASAAAMFLFRRYQP